MRKNPINLPVLASFGCLALSAPAQAEALDDLRAEIQAQKARLEKLEARLQATAASADRANQKAEQASKAVAEAAVPAKDNSLSMPAGLSIYGIADAGIEIGDYGNGTKVRAQSGIGSASRLGFKGLREFGDDLSAYFQLEAGVSIDNGQSSGHSSNISKPGGGNTSSAAPNTTGIAVFSRNTFVGLKSKKFGDLRLGRDYAPIYSLARSSDPFRIGGGTAYRLWGSAAVGRFDNGIFYASPKLAGFQGKIAYSAGMENNSEADVGVTGGAPGNIAGGPQGEGKGGSASLTYAKNQLFVGAAYLSFQRSGTVAAPATENINRSSYNLAATYNFGFVKVYGQYLVGKDTQNGAAVNPSLDSAVWWLGASIPFADRHIVRGVYGHLDDRLTADRDSDHFGLGYEFALDKQTDLYAYYAQVSNQNGGQNSICAGGTCQGYDKNSGLPPNYTPKSLMFGARYRF